jgi:NAD+ kinase
VLSVAVDGTERWTAVTDVALITAEAAHISEYDIVAGEDRLDCVRADGVVVATPAGSTGYARRLGGPVLAPGTGAVVFPIAPFATDPDHWVVDPDGLSVALERDDAPVELVVDDAVATEVDPTETVTLSVAGHVDTAVLPASRSRYE